jgi:TolA-binding protein
MRSSQFLFVVTGCALLFAGRLLAESLPRAATQSTTPVSSSEITPTPAAVAGSAAADDRIAQLEQQVAALQAKCARLERMLEAVQDFEARIKVVEENHGRTQSQMEQFQLARRTRPLNSTEVKETSDLISKRIKSTETQLFQIVRAQQQLLRNQMALSVSPPRQEERPFGP